MNNKLYYPTTTNQIDLNYTYWYETATGFYPSSISTLVRFVLNRREDYNEKSK